MRAASNRSGAASARAPSASASRRYPAATDAQSMASPGAEGTASMREAICPAMESDPSGVSPAGDHGRGSCSGIAAGAVARSGGSLPGPPGLKLEAVDPTRLLEDLQRALGHLLLVVSLQLHDEWGEGALRGRRWVNGDRPGVTEILVDLDRAFHASDERARHADLQDGGEPARYLKGSP